MSPRQSNKKTEIKIINLRIMKVKKNGLKICQFQWKKPKKWVSPIPREKIIPARTKR